jgi:hypothetical protein
VLKKQDKVRPAQDNCRNIVNTLENGSNFTKRVSQQLNKSQLSKDNIRALNMRKLSMHGVSS